MLCTIFVSKRRQTEKKDLPRKLIITPGVHARDAPFKEDGLK